jgi:hypothetical protein
MSDFKPEGQVLEGQLRHTWNRVPGEPPIHTLGEGHVRSTNESGGYIGRRDSSIDRANRGEPSAPPV